MPIKNFVISFLIIASTVAGGTCFFGFCASADSGYIIEPEGFDRDVPIAEAIIKEDGKLEGKVLTIAKPEIDFGQNFDLAKNQKKVISVETPKAARASVPTVIAKNEVKADKKADAEMASVLAEIKKQEKEVRELLSELKTLKDTRDLAKKDISELKTVAKKTDENVVEKTDESLGDSAPHLDVAKVGEVQAEEKDETVLMAMKGGNIVAKKDSSVEKGAVNKQKKYQPMIVESTKKKPAVVENFDTAFKDYSSDDSGRDDTFAGSDVSSGGFEKAFSALRPEKSKTSPTNIVAERRKKAGAISSEVSKESVKNFRNAYLSSDDVKKDFYNTYITENRYLSPFEEDGDDGASKPSGKRNYDILQLKIEFQENSTALSATDVNILRYFVYTAQNDPTKGVQITIGQDNMNNVNKKKLTARRLAIVNAIFKEEGLSDSQVIPILTDRDTESFAFSIIPVDKMENYRKGGEKDMFGDTIGSSQTFRTMKW